MLARWLAPRRYTYRPKHRAPTAASWASGWPPASSAGALACASCRRSSSARQPRGYTALSAAALPATLRRWRCSGKPGSPRKGADGNRFARGRSTSTNCSSGRSSAGRPAADSTSRLEGAGAPVVHLPGRGPGPVDGRRRPAASPLQPRFSTGWRGVAAASAGSTLEAGFCQRPAARRLRGPPRHPPGDGRPGGDQLPSPPRAQPPRPPSHPLVWLETHFRTCTHPAVVGMSEHMLIVCRKEDGSVAAALP